jgi:hypothetical protein
LALISCNNRARIPANSRTINLKEEKYIFVVAERFISKLVVTYESNPVSTDGNT